jgi:DNA-binding MarR family transcriptional regulator
VVRITPAGRRALRSITRAVDAYTTEFLSPLDEDERLRLVRTLGRLYAGTAEATAPGSGSNAARHG